MVIISVRKHLIYSIRAVTFTMKSCIKKTSNHLTANLNQMNYLILARSDAKCELYPCKKVDDGLSVRRF